MKTMNLKNMTFITLFIGSYYFLYSLATTQNIKNPTQEITSEAITPNLISRLSFDQIIQSSSKDAIILELNNQEKTIWTTLEKIISKTKKECDALKEQKEWIEEYRELVEKMITKSANSEKISEENYKLASTIIIECGLDLQSIIIAPWNELSPAASTDHVLFINETLFKQIPVSVQRFILAHEISHIVMKDHSTDFVIAKLKEINNIPSHKFNNTLNILSQFVEARADILACLRNSEYTKGQIEFMEHELSLESIIQEDYPSDATRLKIGRNILAIHTTNQSILS